jgi:hypothetical protein
MRNNFLTSWISSFRKPDNKNDNKDVKYVSKEEMKILYNSWEEEYNIYDNIKKDRDKWKKLFYEKKCEECFKYKENYEKIKKNRDEWEKYALRLKKSTEKDLNNLYLMKDEIENMKQNYEEKYDNMEKDRDKWKKNSKEWRELCYDFRNERSHYRIYI